MPPPDPSSERIRFAGETKPGRPVWERGPVGPWGAWVKILPIERRGRATLFNVCPSWRGPPLPLMPDPGRPVDASDSYVTDRLELARRIAGAAADELGAGRVPDLRALARRLDT